MEAALPSTEKWTLESYTGDVRREPVLLGSQLKMKNSCSRLVSRARLSCAGRESGQTSIRLWCCILSSSVLNEVGVNMIGTCSEKTGFR